MVFIYIHFSLHGPFSFLTTIYYCVLCCEIKEGSFIEYLPRSPYNHSRFDKEWGSSMFSDKLATSLLIYLQKHNLSYEAASELCDISPRYFGDIARRKTAPTIKTLEKICNGLDLTPAELLGDPSLADAVSYRTPMPVCRYRVEPGLLSPSRYAVCPRCGEAIEFDYQHFCGCCGQMLDWTDYEHAKPLTGDSPNQTTETQQHSDKNLKP